MRVNRGGDEIKSGFIERVVTESKPRIFSSGMGKGADVVNNFVFAISTNFGIMSEDIIESCTADSLGTEG